MKCDIHDCIRYATDVFVVIYRESAGEQFTHKIKFLCNVHFPQAERNAVMNNTEYTARTFATESGEHADEV